MTLTHQQIEALKHGDPIRVPAPEVGTDCVVVRADVYDRMGAETGEGLSMEQVGALVEQNMRDDDQNDPLLDSYQTYRQ